MPQIKKNLIPHSQPWITNSDIAAVTEVLTNGMIAKGEKVKEFEQAVTNYFGALGAISAGSGTCGLVLALMGLGVSNGDEVILPSYVCRSVLDAVIASGATPVISDVGENWVMTPEIVERHISKRTKALILVHIFGIASDARKFLTFGVPIIEDCCQAFGLRINEEFAGTIGKVGVFSFHATKCLTSGEGGMIIATDAELLQKMLHLRDQNFFPTPFSDLQAALGLNQLNRYASFLEKRSAIAKMYFSRFPEEICENLFSLNIFSMYFRFPLRYKNSAFESIQEFFSKKDIAVRRGVDTLLHRKVGLHDKDFPNSVKCFDETVSVPILPHFSNQDLDQIISSVLEYERNR